MNYLQLSEHENTGEKNLIYKILSSLNAKTGLAFFIINISDMFVVSNMQGDPGRNFL